MKALQTILISIAALLLALPAEARVRVVEQSYEASPGQIVLPTSTGGGLVLRRCPTCDPHTIPTSPDTRYLVGDSELTLAAFGRHLREHPRANLTVMVSVRTGKVTRIKVQDEAPAPAAAPKR